MASGKFVTYYRVSTQRQGSSGLGLDAQRDAVRQFLNGGEWEIVGEFVEIESGKKTDMQRPQLAAALAMCKKHGAKLLVAKLDRLARNVHFVSGLMQAGVKFVAVDLPEANDLTIHIMAAFAEHEAKRISQRTKDALAVKKAQGHKLGNRTNLNQAQAKGRETMVASADAFAARTIPLISRLKTVGLSLNGIAEQLNASGVATARGGRWTAKAVSRIVCRHSNATH